MIGLGGDLLAQQPLAQLAQGNLPSATPQAATVTSASYVKSGQGDCCSSCPAPTKTICVAEPTTKVTIKPAYSKVCEPFCLPKLSLFSSSRDACATGCSTGCTTGCANCEHPRTKYYLVVKPCVQECPATVCKPVQVPACTAPCSKCTPGCTPSNVTPTSATSSSNTATFGTLVVSSDNPARGTLTLAIPSPETVATPK